MKPPRKPKPSKPAQTSQDYPPHPILTPVLVHHLVGLERERQAARKLDPRDLANPPHKPPKFDIKF